MLMPRTLTREQVRRVDEIAVNDYGMSSLVLMENAGRGVVDVLLGVDSSLQVSASPRKFVVILCGKGNNAGDGLVIARHLEIRGVQAKVLFVAPSRELRGDARHNAQLLAQSDVPQFELLRESIHYQLDELANNATWLIDAMLGTGAVGEPRSPFDDVIAWMNAQQSRRLAIDLPSGLDCDTGVPAKATVRADLTCTFVAMKPGFLKPEAQPYLGDVRVVSIGVPPRLVQEAAGV